MLLKSIQLENIRSYLDDVIEFPPGSTLLSGDVGCGKSTILLAMDFALFGLRKGELEGGDLLRHGAGRGGVHLAFEIDGNKYAIERTLRRSKDSVTQDSGMLSVNGREEELMPVELKSRVLELFGYPQEVLKKNRPIFRYTVYTPQERMKDILLDGDVRLATLRKIFSIDRYGQVKSGAKILVTELRSMKRESDAFASGLEQKMAEKMEKEAEKEKALVMLDRYSSEVSALDMLIKEKEGDLESLRRKMSELNALRREMARVESEIKAKSQRIPRIEAELRDIREKIGRLSPPDIEYDKDDIKRKVGDLEGKKERIVSEHAVVSSELSRLEDVMQKGVCSFCGQRVSDRSSFQKHLEEKSRISGELRKNMGFSSAEIARLKEELSLAEKAESERRLSGEYSERKAGLESELVSASMELAALKDELSALSAQLPDESGLEEMFSSLQRKISDINKSRTTAEKEKSRCEQQLYDTGRFLGTAEKEIVEKKKAKEKAAHIGGLISWLDACFVPLMDIIERHVLSAIQQIFSEFFQKWFNIIMGEQFAVKIDETFSPAIEQNGYRTEYSNLSGGEKTAVALAYRLALTKVINSMIDTIKTRDLLILDEPTDGFSSEQLDRLRDVLAELQLKQVILVSHESKIDSFVDNVIKIYKEEHVSKVVY